MSNEKHLEFKAIPSGDYESFCFDVDKKTFKNIKNVEPSEFDKSFFNKGMYRIYPDDLFKLNDRNNICNIKLTIQEED